MSIRKIDLMHRFFGLRVGKRCRDCPHFVRGRYHDRILRKCKVYGLTHSEASDWAGRWDACGMFGRDYTGGNVIELVRHNGCREPIREDENQITLGEVGKI